MACRLSIATSLPKSKHQACLAQLQHSLDDAIRPSMQTLESWAVRHGVVCLHDHLTIDNPWTLQFMDDTLKGRIRKALRPSLQFRVRLYCSLTVPSLMLAKSNDVVSDCCAHLASYSFSAHVSFITFCVSACFCRKSFKMRCQD